MGLHIFSKETKIDFVGMRRWGYALSAIALLIGLLAITMNGIKYGVDFAGGAAVQLEFQKPVADEAIKKTFAALDLPGMATQQFGEDGRSHLIRFSISDKLANEDIRTAILHALETSPELQGNPATIERLETVGPKVGADLRNAALEAMFYSILLITVYISGRFEQRWVVAGVMALVLGGAMYIMGLAHLSMPIRVFGSLVVTMIVCWKLGLNFALGAIVGLLHDVLLTVGLLTLMGKEFDLNIIAALLTLVGYSLNDTIIIYDRIRENLRMLPPGNLPSMAQLINDSVNQTLARTIMTSATTLLACLSLYLLGGGVIHDFALTMLIGIFVGTFSTVFVSAPILIHFGDTAKYLVPAKGENEQYERPGEHGVV